MIKMASNNNGCEYCGIKENCNNYWLGKEDARKEFLERLEYINTGEGYTKEYYRNFLMRLIKELKQSLEEKKK
jgi:hypothetical protein